MRRFGFIIILLFCANIAGSQEESWALKKHREYLVERRDPWFATLLSLFLPGAGQFYNHDWVKGTLSLAGIVGWLKLISYTEADNGVEARPYANFGALCLLGHWIFSPIDAHFSAINKNIEMKRSLGLIDVGLYDIGIVLSYRF